jgi:hypothetical protein
MPLTSLPVLGIAGNFTGHLEQAGEAADFVAVSAAAGKPKGIFPMYLPIAGHRLGLWPFSTDTLRLPRHEADVQPEPELALRVALTWRNDRVVALRPSAFCAFDDTSIRRPAQPKISMKKNWGPNSKGMSTTWIGLDRFDSNGVLHHIRLASFLIRDGLCKAYGEDSAVRDYSTMYGELVAWSIDKLANQADVGPLEAIGQMLVLAGQPTEAVLSIGATRYTAHGEGNFVRAGDVVVIVAYDERSHRPADIAEAAADGASIEGASVLRRTVEAG